MLGQNADMDPTLAAPGSPGLLLLRQSPTSQGELPEGREEDS